MHRSATSLAAMGLHNSSVSMGTYFLAKDSGNIHGYFEDMSFLNLNKSILLDAGGRWDKPPSRQKIIGLAPKYGPIIKELVAEKKKPLWGWKDPRTTLTIELFIPYIENPHFIVCFRDTMEVAKSLQRRNGFPINQGLSLAKVYNRRLLEFLIKWTEINKYGDRV